MIISIQNPKGGVGKSLTAIFLANFLAYDKKHSVLLVDGDPQGTILNIRDSEIQKNVDLSGAYDLEEFRSSSPSKWKQYLDRRIAKGYEYVIIDTAGSHGHGEKSYLAQISDAVVIPIIAEQSVLVTTAEFAMDLQTIVGKKTKLLAISAMARRVKEQEEIGIISEVGLTLVGSLPQRVKYSRHQSTTRPVKDASLDKLMRTLYKQIQL